MKNKTSFLPLLTVGILLLLTNSCKKDEPDNNSAETDAIFNPDITYGSLTDPDGNVYKTVTIGTQTWMAENLRTTKYRNGDPIPNVTDNAAWIGLTTGAYCTYNNTTDADKIATYGRLYNWFTITDSRNIAPTGWHVSTEADWTILNNYLGGESVAGGKLKETGTTHWNSPNEADNNSGFTALPGGCRYTEGSYIDLGLETYWWIPEETTSANSYFRLIYHSTISTTHDIFPKISGLSVRCVRDN